MMLEKAHRDGVTTFVISGELLFLIGHDAALALRAGDDPVDRFLELRHADGLLVAAGSEDRALVYQIGEVGARETRCDFGDDGQLDGLVERLALGVHFENRLAAVDIWGGQHDLAIEDRKSTRLNSS